MVNNNGNYLKLFNLFLILMLYISISISPANAQKKIYGEYEVKAAFIYNFLKFIEWPEGSFSDGTINLCILGDDPFGTVINPVEGDFKKDKKIVIKRYNKPTGIEGCHVLFICRSEKRHLSEILNSIKGMKVLTISDTEGFAKQGVVINFYIEEDKVRFEINKDAADKAGLKISSRLLNLARIIHGEER
jgi:hypothetical protein